MKATKNDAYIGLNMLLNISPWFYRNWDNFFSENFTCPISCVECHDLGLWRLQFFSESEALVTPLKYECDIRQMNDVSDNSEKKIVKFQ